MAKVILSWRRVSDGHLIVEAQKIIDGLIDNPSFGELQTEAEEIKILNEDFLKAYVKAGDGSVLDTAMKKDNRKLLTDKLYSVGLKVQLICKGDATMILGAGFKTNNERHRVGALQQPSNVVIKAGKSKGSLVIRWDKIANAVAYIMEYTQAPAGVDSRWLYITTTRREITIYGLKSGDEFVFKIAGIGSNPSLTWSDEKTSFVM